MKIDRKETTEERQEEELVQRDCGRGIRDQRTERVSERNYNHPPFNPLVWP